MAFSHFAFGVAAPASLTPFALPGLPDANGFAGMYAGQSNGVLLCAGGSNFPERPLADGGKKIWHDGVFALSSPSAPWSLVGHLPRRAGYGASGTWRDAVVCAGGGDETENFADAWLLRWNGTMLSTERLPKLPFVSANCCGAVVGSLFFVCGGQARPDAVTTLRDCAVLDLSRPADGWMEIPWPVSAPGRILAVTASHDGWFYVFSGADLVGDGALARRRYLTDAWRYRALSGWERLPDLPRSVAAAPSPAAVAAGGRLVILGGVSPGFLSSIPAGGPHPGFSREQLRYDIALRRWEVEAGDDLPEFAPARVTAPSARWRNLYVVPSGEIRPGVRTPSVESYLVSP